MPLYGLRTLFSVQTLLSGLLGIAVWSFYFDWRTGLALVLLLYIHEVGHILAAQWRRVPVLAPPVIVPGLGAFVIIGHTSSVWNEVLVALGGPVIGGVSSFLLGLAGRELGLPWLAWVGGVGMLINLLNLLPMLPFDGGRVTSRAGWIALLGGAVIGILVAVELHFEYLLLFVAFATYRHFNQEHPKTRWYEGLSALLLLVVTGGGLFFLWRYFGPAPRPVMNPLPALRPLQLGALLFTVWYLGGGALYQATRRQWTKPRAEYLMRLLLLSPQYTLTGRPSLILTMCMLLGKLWGRPTLPGLERQVLRLARGQTLTCGIAASAVYDALHRSSDPALQDWRTRVMPLLAEANFEAYVMTCVGVLELDREAAGALIRERSGEITTDLSLLSAEHLNNLAWLFLQTGEPALARPYAEAAHERQPESGSVMDTLGQVYLTLGEDAAAEPLLRGAVQRINYLGARTGLARALAGQGRLSEAIQTAREALRRHESSWPLKEPTRAEVQGWITDWQRPEDPPVSEGAD